MFAKVLVANRGEIAVRAFRAAYELGAQTVAVFPYEDRNAVHRIKADEAYTIGERGHPVRAYLDIAEIIRAAKQSGADAIYPGYGFLSENPDLARACVEAGITFIGPPADVLTWPATRSGPWRRPGRPASPRSSRPRPRPTWTSSSPAPRRSASRSSSRRSPAAVGAACGGSTIRPSCASWSRRRCARPRARSATRRPSSSRRSAGRGTSRCRSSPTPRAPRCTCTSGTARSSGGTRRSSRSRRRRTSPRSCGRRCAPTR